MSEPPKLILERFVARPAIAASVRTQPVVAAQIKTQLPITARVRLNPHSDVKVR